MEYNFAVVKIGALFITFILLSMLLIVSCDEAIDAERPVVSILSPLDGATASTADGIQISASITDNGELLQYKIVVSGIDSLNGIAKDSTLRMVIIGGLSGSIRFQRNHQLTRFYVQWVLQRDFYLLRQRRQSSQ